MIWLLTEILVFVAAAAVFGGLIGLGLAGSGSKRRLVAFERGHQGLVDQVREFERSQRTVEAKAVARGAAEAAARGDLETRLVDTEAAAADYRARAEAAERRVHLMQSPGRESPELIETVRPVAAAAANGGAEVASLRSALEATESARGKAELDLRQTEADRDKAQSAVAAAEQAVLAERALRTHEIESLRAQLALAERVRARKEIDLAVAHARAEEAMRAAAGHGPAAPAARAATPPPTPAPPAPAPSVPAPTAPAPTAAASLDGDKPSSLAAPRGGRADDLRRIKGIGPKNEGVLNSLGIYHYEQIAALTAANIAWLDAYMKFHGRIARDDWVGQAKALLGVERKVLPQDAGA